MTTCWHTSYSMPTQMKHCDSCGMVLDPTRFADAHSYKRAKYCNRACYVEGHKRRTEMRLCSVCGTQFEVNIHAKNIYCSAACRYEDAKRDGAEYVAPNGYVYIKVRGHPVAAKSGGYMLKHRYVMEQHLGRLLTTEETIHHKDGNKQNNNINNLELLSNSQHVTLHNQQQVEATGVAAINTPIAIAKRTRTRRWNRIAQRILSVS